jgi:hypothetical protein
MTSVAPLRKLFKPILAKNPDLVLQGRWLIRPPLKNVFVGLYVEPSSSSHDWSGSIYFLPLSLARNSYNKLFCLDGFQIEYEIGVPPLSYEVEKRLRAEGRPIPPRIIQDIHAPDFQDYLIHNFNVKARPLFDEEWNLDKAIAWLTDYIAKPARGYPQEFHGWAAAVTGDFANAEALLTEQCDIWASFGAHRKEYKYFKQLESLIAQLKTRDPAAIADYLHGLEAATIDEYKLDTFWQRTPFPFEESHKS